MDKPHPSATFSHDAIGAEIARRRALGVGEDPGDPDHPHLLTLGDCSHETLLLMDCSLSLRMILSGLQEATAAIEQVTSGGIGGVMKLMKG